MLQFPTVLFWMKTSVSDTVKKVSPLNAGLKVDGPISHPPVQLTSGKLKEIKLGDRDNPGISPLLVVIFIKKLLLIAAIIGTSLAIAYR